MPHIFTRCPPVSPPWPYPIYTLLWSVLLSLLNNSLPQMRKTLALLAEPLDHVIVVENGSTDGTREWLASLTILALT
jgi:glycosyltransferase involved in cell wall biosynthesis